MGLQKTIEALEWRRFLDIAAAEARTEPGKAVIQGLLDPTSWAPDTKTAEHRQRETQEVLGLLAKDALWSPLSELTNPATALDSLERGATLEVGSLVLLRSWLYAIDAWSQVPRDQISGEYFKKALLALPDPHAPLRIVEQLLTPDGELSERASPRLASLHQEVRSLKKEIAGTLDHLMKSFFEKGVLQEKFYDVRDGRYVLPVKLSHQNQVEGILYEASASRQTIFVEPKEISPLNNRLRQKQNDLVQEIYLVLTEASKKLRPFADEIQGATQILIHWDAVQARARSGLHYSGRPLQVTEDRVFILSQTAHPLLWKALPPDTIVRNEIHFEIPAQVFMITGPNTGGKTVLLKTLGLAGLCARTGFPFPGTGQLVVPFFDSFFADLGDPQSIEQHLSSFSGHVLGFKDILENLTPRSLVLIDELNTATDPEEGAALGRAFLETLIEKGAIVVTTTHDPRLKAMSVTDSRILNASMAFDESSRLPTFRLAMGVPGLSRALDTAERLGIPASVLKLARSYLSKEHNEFERVLAKLQTDLVEATKLKNDAQRVHDEAAALQKEWVTRTRTSINDVLDKTRQRLRRILEMAQDEVRDAVRALSEARSHKQLDETRARLNATLSNATKRIDSALTEESPDIAEAIGPVAQAPTAPGAAEVQGPRLTPGLSVRVPSWRTTGKIMEILGEKVRVAIGNLQVTLAVHEVETLSEAEAKNLKLVEKSQARSAGIRQARAEAPPPPPSEIDLRGIRLDDAMSQLESYLDQAFRSGALAEVTVVHGLGTGALREGARKLLKELPYVKSFQDGGVGRGGSGATVVLFDRD